MGIETALLVGSMASTAGSMGMSISQASQARRDRDEADREAQRLTDEVESQLEINPFDALAIQKEPYEMAMDAAVEAAAIESQALAEADPRYLAGLAGKRRIGQEEALQGVRAAMGQEMLGLEKMSAAEESRLRDQRADFLTGQAIGQMNEADRQEAIRQQSVSGAIQSGAQLMGQASKAADLFSSSPQEQMETLSELPETVKKMGVKVGMGMIGGGITGTTSGIAGAASGMSDLTQNQISALQSLQKAGITNEQLSELGNILESGDAGMFRKFRRGLGDKYETLFQAAQTLGM